MRLENIHKAKTNLSKLIDEAYNGEEVIICKSGKPIAKIIPYQKQPLERSPGLWKGKITIKEDFEILPESILKSFKGENE